MKAAILYDFDKTLSTTDMQNFDFIKNLGISNEEFWKLTDEFSNKNNADKILSYMYQMVKISKEKNIKLTHEYLKSCGKSIELLNGVLDWFIKINQFAFNLGIELEHYIVSSGIEEIIEGTDIYKYFKAIFGCSFIYENDIAVWPKTSMNYTQKTQFIFRIAKGTLDIKDEKKVNEKTKDFRINYSNMIYIGDGITDVPSMTVIKNNGGHSIAVYRDNKDIAYKLIKDDRVDFVALADYSEGSLLFETVKLMLANMALNSRLKDKELDALKDFLGDNK